MMLCEGRRKRERWGRYGEEKREKEEEREEEEGRRDPGRERLGVDDNRLFCDDGEVPSFEMSSSVCLRGHEGGRALGASWA